MPDLDWSNPEDRRIMRRNHKREKQEARRAERMAESGFEPLKITARLQAPVISDRSLPIDGIFYFVAHREALDRQDVTTPGAQTNPGLPSMAALPLARVNEGCSQWFYAASWAQWGPSVSEGMDHWNCRFDTGLTDYLEMPKARLDISSGRYKSYHMPVFTRHALAVCWYVVGHAPTIERWLKFVTHLGKKPSQGYGAVLDWQIEPSEDFSVRDASSRIMRAIPDPAGSRLIGFRPSYWLPANQALCLTPE